MRDSRKFKLGDKLIWNTLEPISGEVVAFNHESIWVKWQCERSANIYSHTAFDRYFAKDWVKVDETSIVKRINEKYE